MTITEKQEALGVNSNELPGNQDKKGNHRTSY